jgi:hypothetical protein
MDQLARFVFQLTNGRKAEDINLSEAERSALADLQPVLRGSPNDLATWLSQGHLSAEEWLIPPPAVVSHRHCP